MAFVEIPVVSITGQAAVTADSIGGSPAILVTFFGGQDVNEPNAKGIDCWAMLDTGAYSNHVDELLSSYFPPSNARPSTIMNATSQEPAMEGTGVIRAGGLILPISYSVHALAPAIAARTPIVLGRTFLALGCFQYALPQNGGLRFAIQTTCTE